MNNIKIIDKIYNNIFIKLYLDTCCVFLCGGIGKECIRDKTRLHLEKNDIQVLYPEDLFIEMFNKNKKKSLLDYENFLGKSSDYILIICESFGSAAELGAFVQNAEIKDKVLIAINKKYIRNNSFIMDGPVKSIKNKDPKRIFEYDIRNLENFYNNIDKCFIKRKSSQLWKQFYKTEPDFKLLPTYISLIPLIVYFYRTINRQTLFVSLKKWLIKVDKCPDDYNEIFNAAIKYLLKLGIITMSGVVDVDKELNEQVLQLSVKGLNRTINNLNTSNISYKMMLQDEIRYDILKEQFYN